MIDAAIGSSTRGNHALISDADWSHQTRLSPNHDVMSYPSTTGDPNLCDQNRMGSDRHVMSDLNQVVDFCSLSNDRLSKCSSIDRDICSQLDIVFDRDSAKLGDFVMPPLVLDIAESVASDNRPAVNDHSRSDCTTLPDQIGRAHV